MGRWEVGHRRLHDSRRGMVVWGATTHQVNSGRRRRHHGRRRKVRHHRLCGRRRPRGRCRGGGGGGGCLCLVTLGVDFGVPVPHVWCQEVAPPCWTQQCLPPSSHAGHIGSLRCPKIRTTRQSNTNRKRVTSADSANHNCRGRRGKGTPAVAHAGLAPTALPAAKPKV
eukprot:COSAG01_NODE_403_length_17482_cov_77.249597_2_plen_168_part_00